MALKKHIVRAGFYLTGILLSLGSYDLRAQAPKLQVQHGDLWVTGLDPEVLYTFSRYFNSQKDWESVFPITLKGNVEGIVVNGIYEVLNDAVRFTPRFPFAPRVSYSARFFANELAGNRNEVYLPAMNESLLELDFSVQASDSTPPLLLEVYPTANVLPENLLKFHLRFSKSMTLGEAYQRVKLLDGAGTEIEKPFLVIDQELWDNDMTMLTILLDPGRIKRGLRPNLEMKPALRESQKYSLVVERGWKDIDGNLTASDFVKTFECGAPDRTSPAVKKFAVIPPTSYNATLVVQLHETMNYVALRQGVRILNNEGVQVEGKLHLKDGEKLLEFVPKNPWLQSHYTIEFNSLVEDLAGNNFNRLFDEDLHSGKRSIRPSTTLSFEVAIGSSQ